jgi:hypothetical protein
MENILDENGLDYLNKIYKTVLSKYYTENEPKEEDVNFEIVSSDENLYRDYAIIPLKQSGENNSVFSIITKKHTDINNSTVYKNAIIDSIFTYISKSTYSLESLFDKEKFDKNISKIKELSDEFISGYVNKITYNSIDLIKKLVSEKYETMQCIGSICFYYNDSDIIIKLDEMNPIYFEINNAKLIRKLIQTSNEKISIGIKYDEKAKQSIVAGYVEPSKNNLYIRFNGQNSWSVHEKNSEIVCCENDSFIIKSKIDNNETLIRNKKEIDAFNPSLYEQINNFVNEIRNPLNTKFNGALLIFTDNNKFAQTMYEHKRALKPSNETKISLSSADLERELLVNLCNIDGAVVFDQEGNLSSYATILDGLSTNSYKNNIARGSRYNSTITFLKYYKKEKGGNYLAIVISVDGPIEVFNASDIQKEK